jgi:hypothetical protein
MLTSHGSRGFYGADAAWAKNAATNDAHDMRERRRKPTQCTRRNDVA